MDPKELNQMWKWFKKRFDFNNDGTITFDEFTEGQFSYCLRL